MRSSLLAFLFLTACAKPTAHPQPPIIVSVCPPPPATPNPDAACLDLAENCLKEARGRHLYDPLDAYTDDQAELVSHRACLKHVTECRGK